MRYIISSVFSFFFVCILLLVMAAAGINTYFLLAGKTLLEILGERLFPVEAEGFAIFFFAGILSLIVLIAWGGSRSLKRKENASELAQLREDCPALQDEVERLVEAHDSKQEQLQKALQDIQQLQVTNRYLNDQVGQLQKLIVDATPPEMVLWLKQQLTWFQQQLGKAAVGVPVPPPMPKEATQAPSNGVPQNNKNESPSV